MVHLCLAGLPEVKFLDIEVLQLERDTDTGGDGVRVSDQTEQEQELVEVQSRFAELSALVILRFNHRSLVVFVFVICFPEQLLQIELLLAVSDWRQSLLHQFLQRFNVEHVRDQVLVTA